MEHKKFVKQYGITEKSLPSAIIFDAPKKMHFKNVDIKVKGALGHYLKAIALGEEDPTAEGYMAYYYTVQKLFNRTWPYRLNCRRSFSGISCNDMLDMLQSIM